MTQVTAIIDIEGTELKPEDQELLSHPSVSGLILFTRNYESRQQLSALTQAIKHINPTLMVCVDQEGGRVQRFREGFSELKAMSYFAELYTKDPELALSSLRDQIRVMVHELRSVGVTASLVPVVDLDYGRSDIIGERSLGAQPEGVIELARCIIATLHEQGMPATLKHFPGHGYVRADSHLELPVDSRSFDDILRNDLKPFAALQADVEMIMPAHIIFDQVDARPVGFSPVWLQDILRRRLGFKGKIITDDLSMQGAATAFGGYAERAEAAIDAGCDYLLVCNNRDGAISVIETLEKRILA